jgi:hypothetical protein
MLDDDSDSDVDEEEEVLDFFFELLELLPIPPTMLIGGMKPLMDEWLC